MQIGSSVGRLLNILGEGKDNGITKRNVIIDKVYPNFFLRGLEQDGRYIDTAHTKDV